MSKFLPFLFFILSISCHLSCSSPNSSNVAKTVYIKDSPEGYQLMRNGEPYFIKGVSGSAFLNELVHSGGNTVRSAATVFMNVLEGKGTEAQNNVVCANAGMAVHTATGVPPAEGFEKARKSLLSGKALESFSKLQQLSQA